MRIVIVAVLCLGVGLLGGAWSARGEVKTLRGEADRLRRERDRVRKTKTAADLAMMARLGQAEQRCPTPPPVPDPALPRARPVAPTGPAPEPVPPEPPKPVTPPRDSVDREQAFEEFAAEVELRQDQRAAIRQLGVEFQRSLEEGIGGFLARFAMIEATGETPRPREIAQASDRLLHTYLDADDRLRALLDPDQRELLEQSEFDIVRLIDFESLSRMAEQHRHP